MSRHATSLLRQETNEIGSNEPSHENYSTKINELEARLSNLEDALKNVTQILDARTKADDKPPEGYRITGENNRIIIAENGIERSLGEHEKFEGLNLLIKGNNNNLRFELPIRFTDAIIQIEANDTEIHIGNSINFCVVVRCLFGNNQKFYWGKGSRTTGPCVVWLQRENASVVVGKDCLFAPEVSIWGFDGHLILDKDTDEVLNEVNEPIMIGNHCWIGASTRLLKNARLPANTVVGGGSVVTHAFTEEYIVIAGNPARVVKTNRVWK